MSDIQGYFSLNNLGSVFKDMSPGAMAKGPFQPDNLKQTGSNQICQHLARSNRRQLVGIPYKKHLRRISDRLQKHCRYINIHHGGFIQDHIARCNWIVLTVHLKRCVWMILQQLMDCLCLLAGRIDQSLGSHTSWRRQSDFGCFSLQSDVQFVEHAYNSL